MDKQFVKDFEIGFKVSSYFKIDTIDRRLKKNGDSFLSLLVSDMTGSIPAVAWENVDDIHNVILENRIVFLTGEVVDYNGQQFNVKQARLCKEGEYVIGNLIKTIPGRDKILDKIKDMLGLIENPWISKLVSKFLEDNEFMIKFMNVPGGWKWHHSYLGGLMRHTYEVMEICLKMSQLHEEINLDLCLIGAFMHDIGKVVELEYKPVFEYTDPGRLVGHIVLGNNIMLEKIAQIADFPQDLKMELQHILLSHQGEYEQRSPVVPQTVEACVVYHADNLDSQVNAFKSIIFGPREKGQDWSKWLTIINRQLKLREGKDVIF